LKAYPIYFSGDYKRNEQLLMAKLDQIEHNHSDKGENKGMGAAVEATEEIRRWVS